MLLQRLRDLREDMDLYQKDIADYLHCSQVTYSRYELGTREIPLESLNALADLTQKQVAQYLQMSQTGYSKYETGENDIPTVVWEHLADFYGVSVDYLMGRTDEKKPYPKGNR